MIDTNAHRIESKHKKVKGGMESQKASLDIDVGEVEKSKAFRESLGVRTSEGCSQGKKSSKE